MEFSGFSNLVLLSNLSILLFNVFIYIYSTTILFIILFNFNLRKLDSLSNLKLLGLNKFFLFHILISLMTLAGLPPLVGFFSKLMIFNAILQNNQYILLVVFCFFNFFSIYFYVQNFRFLISNNKKAVKPLKKNFFVYFIINIMFFFNFFSFFFLDTIFMYFNLILYSILV